MNCISGGRARWEVIRQEGIKTYIARIIEKRDITKKCRVFKDHLEIGKIWAFERVCGSA